LATPSDFLLESKMSQYDFFTAKSEHIIDNNNVADLLVARVTLYSYVDHPTTLCVDFYFAITAFV
jgi:hypothetical protein